MRFLLLLAGLFYTSISYAQDVVVDKLPIFQGSYQFDGSSNLPAFWVLEREMILQDARAVSLYLSAPAGTRAWFEVTSLNPSTKTSNKKKRLQTRSVERMERSGAGKSWAIDFITVDGRVQNYLQIQNPNYQENEGLGFIFPDACKTNGKYLLRLVVDFRESGVLDFPVLLNYTQSTPPKSQATLFKFPSEKSSSQAVILMRTSGVGPEFLQFTTSNNGVPRETGTIAVDNYYFSNLGTFTRVYLSSSYLTGQKVSMHHISPDLSSIYSVCVSLQRKRQELEGYN